jgi:hypothetical protein
VVVFARSISGKCPVFQAEVLYMNVDKSGYIYGEGAAIRVRHKVHFSGEPASDLVGSPKAPYPEHGRDYTKQER